MPDEDQRILRDYCRSRLFYTWQQTKTQNRLLKILESNNIKLRSVVSTIHTKTAMDIVRLLAAGVTDKDKLASCARGQIRDKKARLMMARDGTLQEHHLVQMQMLLQDFDHVQKQIEDLNILINGIIAQHYAQAVECLDSISGIAVKSAQNILSEAGKDMTRFPSADHFTAWCGIAPGNK